MKKNLAILGLVLMAVFYCFAINTPSPSHDSASDCPTEERAEKIDYFSLTSAHLLARPFSFQSSVNSTPPTTFSFFNYPFHALAATIEFKKQQFISVYAQYSFSEIIFWVQQKKSNLLYPYHYFW